MRFSEVVAAWSAVRGTRSRKKKIEVLAEALRQARSDLPIVATWLSGDLVQGRIGVGFRMLHACREDAPPPPEHHSLTVTEVDKGFAQIKEQSGPGSTGRKLVYLSRLFNKATMPERAFMVELISGEVRQGAQESVLVEAIARGTELPSDLVRRAFMLCGTVRKVAIAAFHGGEKALAAFRIQPGRPIRPMLAQTAESPGQGLILLGGDAFFDTKLDGVRVQIHREGDHVRVFTRHLKEVTRMVPEVVEAALTFPWSRFVLDAEAIATDAGGTPHPFQITMRRFGRKTDVQAMRQQLPLDTVVFDALMLGDDEMIDAPATERFEALRALPARHQVPRRRIRSPDEADTFYREVIEAGHEGVMAKSPQGIYQAGARGKAWLKIKPTHTLDLIVLAAEWGSGRRQGWLSNLHLGAPDADGNVIMLGKTFKGLTDELLTWQTERLQQLEVERDRHTVWVRPELVVEIAFNDVQRSPHYPGGLALRFARVKRYRPDKTPHEADRYETVAALLPEGL